MLLRNLWKVFWNMLKKCPDTLAYERLAISWMPCSRSPSHPPPQHWIRFSGPVQLRRNRRSRFPLPLQARVHSIRVLQQCQILWPEKKPLRPLLRSDKEMKFLARRSAVKSGSLRVSRTFCMHFRCIFFFVAYLSSQCGRVTHSTTWPIFFVNSILANNINFFDVTRERKTSTPAVPIPTYPTLTALVTVTKLTISLGQPGTRPNSSLMHHWFIVDSTVRITAHRDC